MCRDRSIKCAYQSERFKGKAMDNTHLFEASNDAHFYNEGLGNDEFDNEGFSIEIAEFMILKDNMDSHTYEIEADFKDQLLGCPLKTQSGNTTLLTQITRFEVDQEEYTPALSSDRILNARMLFHVDGECENNGVRSQISKLPVYFDFEYKSHNTGYTISAMSINC